ncbi:unnamed protein product [Rotaria magnacalcarata]|uniref:Uncharacterized protein n=1 Tax=Rotaria magnacalcarata TaxID=392030 RepID=A0A816QYJ2_9BILA|nr:unnamed protein product [Rotaria magnacalcarata]CAF2066208.1 unnamed protein product [Rotaria magnacalcarata]CAF4370289.1 unnamed protein product [Rotaria magnacalcarata]
MTSIEIRPVELNYQPTPCMSSDLNYEDVTLIWVDRNVNETIDCLDTKRHLSTIVNYFKVFDNSKEAVDYIRSASNEHIFLIISGSLCETITPQIHEQFQVKFVYVFCMNKDIYAERTYKYDKIRGMFVSKHELFHHLIDDVRVYENNLLAVDIFSRRHTSGVERSIRDYMTEESITLM